MSVTNEDISGTESITGTGGGTMPTSVLRSTPTPSAPTPTLGPGTPTTYSNIPSSTASHNVSDVVKSGYLRKLKGKKKFFVLRKETDQDKPARLEYYASEKKFRLGHPPRKSIVLKSCFNISGPESNLKSKYSISLHTHNDCVRILMSSEEEMNDWLRTVKALAGEEEDDQTMEGKPHFEHIWMVHALNKGLGSKENIIGPYRLCLTSKELTLLKVGEHDGRNGQVRFPLNVIRNVSHDATFGCFFHIELGRLACTGPGQLSLKTDDNNIAQNMHLLILKAMQNYSKDDIIPPRERARTYTWTNEATMRPSHSTTPAINTSMDEPRIRTDSLPSSGSRVIGIGLSQMTPPIPVLASPPPIYFNSPNMYSTGTDSASSSYSIDYDNNNTSLHGDKSNEEEEYVPFNPMEDQHLSPKHQGNMKLTLNQDINEDANKDSSSNAQTPSSYMEMQSPLSPFDNYLPMSPGGTTGLPAANDLKSNNGKTSVSHSRNSSLIEDTDGYVPMIPGHHSRSESGAGSTAGSATGLDEAYLDMDFTRKMNLSNDDIHRVSPASSESLQSNTPSTDFPLEKVTSYLTDDFDDSMRPARAYSVGSRSDTGAIGKFRAGKNRLEAVQETSRIRAMSVGSKNARKPPANSAASTFAILSSVAGKQGPAPLSSSWSGSTGRWPMSKFSNNNQNQGANQAQQCVPTSISQANSESTDSDLMELDFSKNKKTRKRSHPGPASSLSVTTSATSSSNIQKLSPAAKGILGTVGSEGPSPVDSSDALKTSWAPESGIGRGTSAPISIKGPNVNRLNDANYAYHDPSQSILTRLTGTDLKKLKELDDEGDYLNMDFSKNSSTSSTDFKTPNAALQNNFTEVNLRSVSPKPEPKSVVCNGDIHISSTENSNASSSSPDNSHKSLAPTPLTRIEESPEKLETSKTSSGSVTPQSPSPRPAPLAKAEEDKEQVAYASIEHLTSTGKHASVEGEGCGSLECGAAATASANKAAGVTYAQVDFVKSTESVIPNS